MKKTILSLVMALVSLVAFAGDDVKLTSGSAACIAQPGVVINVVFDYSDSYIYDRDAEKYVPQADYLASKGEDWVKDFPGELKKAEDAFIEEFNNDSKKATMAAGSDKAEYTMTFKLTEFTYGAQVVMFKKQWAYGTGVLEVRKNGSDDVVCKFEFNNVIGNVVGGIGAMELRREQCYEHVSEAVAKILNKTKK